MIFNNIFKLGVMSWKYDDWIIFNIIKKKINWIMSYWERNVSMSVIYKVNCEVCESVMTV